MLDRVILVRMALSTADRHAQPDRARRIDAIDDGIKTEFQRIDPAFLVDHRIAMEAGGDPLPDRRFRQHVAGQLLDGELIERHIRIDGLNDPIAIGPHRAGSVFLVAVGVGISCQVQPAACPAFAVQRRSQQSIHQFFIGIG
jgi:hypothetical protein